MAIPDFEEIMLPLLEFLSDGKEHSLKEAVNHISDIFKLTDEERNALFPSGNDIVIRNRVRWARAYMKKANLIVDPRRGFMKISERGLQVLTKKPQKIDIGFLSQFTEFIDFRALRTKSTGEGDAHEKGITNHSSITPTESIERGYSILKSNLGQELLATLLTNSPEFFEHVVLELLSRLGYGKGEVTGRSGDGGIDGYISQDALRLDKIFFQAKRYNPDTTSVTASMLRDFVGSLTLKGVNKGVFITTSRFPKDANATLSSSHKSIELVDGERLAQLMIDYDVGVETENEYKVKKIDRDFFLEEE